MTHEHWHLRLSEIGEMKDDRPCCSQCGKPTILYAFRGQKQPKEDEAYRLRVRNLIAEFELGGYDTYNEDMSTAIAVAEIMAVEGDKPHLQQLLTHHMERIAAAG